VPAVVRIRSWRIRDSHASTTLNRSLTRSGKTLAWQAACSESCGVENELENHERRSLTTMTTDAINVRFVCKDNSMRSIIAQALLNRFAGNRFPAFSCGLEPLAFTVLGQ
jgi:hypothetical protein